MTNYCISCRPTRELGNLASDFANGQSGPINFVYFLRAQKLFDLVEVAKKK